MKKITVKVPERKDKIGSFYFIDNPAERRILVGLYLPSIDGSSTRNQSWYQLGVTQYRQLLHFLSLYSVQIVNCPVYVFYQRPIRNCDIIVFLYYFKVIAKVCFFIYFFSNVLYIVNFFTFYFVFLTQYSFHSLVFIIEKTFRVV